MTKSLNPGHEFHVVPLMISRLSPKPHGLLPLDGPQLAPQLKSFSESMGLASKWRGREKRCAKKCNLRGKATRTNGLISLADGLYFQTTPIFESARSCAELRPSPPMSLQPFSMFGLLRQQLKLACRDFLS